MLEYVKFKIRGSKKFKNIDVDFNGNYMQVAITDINSPEFDGERLVPCGETQIWLEKLAKLKISKWENDYILDGYGFINEEWSVQYKVKGRKVKHIVGSGDYPANWNLFIDLMDDIALLIEPKRVDGLNLFYSHKGGKEAACRWELLNIDRISEKLTLSREISIGCEVKNEFYVRHGVGELLDSCENWLTEIDDFEDFDVAEQTPTFKLEIFEHCGNVLSLKGNYLNANLPISWYEFVGKINAFMSYYGLNAKILVD